MLEYFYAYNSQLFSFCLSYVVNNEKRIKKETLRWWKWVAHIGWVDSHQRRDGSNVVGGGNKETMISTHIFIGSYTIIKLKSWRWSWWWWLWYCKPKHRSSFLLSVQYLSVNGWYVDPFLLPLFCLPTHINILFFPYLLYFYYYTKNQDVWGKEKGKVRLSLFVCGRTLSAWEAQKK